MRDQHSGKIADFEGGDVAMLARQRFEEAERVTPHVEQTADKRQALGARRLVFDTRNVFGSSHFGNHLARNGSKMTPHALAGKSAS